MKTRFYKRNVIDVQEKWDQTIKQIINNYKKDVILFIVYLISAIAFVVATSMLLYEFFKIRITPVIFTPVIIRWAVIQIQMLHEDRKVVKMLRLNKNDYSDWMNIQSLKQFPEKDRKLACDIFSAYNDVYIEKHTELLELLKEQLNMKPGNALTISVIAGLIFLSNDKNDYKTLFNAKYKHGGAGNVIPNIWIRMLSTDDDFTEKIHNECAEEFLSFWEEHEKEYREGTIKPLVRPANLVYNKRKKGGE
ncbi:MAG: hypothetical protein J1E05_07655 [Eubacterium sp.]|nr:hypothetical protein [Eubacterium sp.]